MENWFASYNLLTAKPTIYAANVAEDDLADDGASNPHVAKVREMDAECVSADEILYMATTGGAHAMQLFDCDSLAVGKKADLVMIDLNQPNMQPENNIVKNLVYSGSKQNVKLTMVNGKILYEDQKFDIGFDPADIYRRANEIIRRMK